jgi:UDP-glucose 4-epimerase
MKRAKILVTGSTGFFGQQVVKALSLLEVDLCIVVRPEKSNFFEQNTAVKLTLQNSLKIIELSDGNIFRQGLYDEIISMIDFYAKHLQEYVKLAFDDSIYKTLDSFISIALEPQASGSKLIFTRNGASAAISAHAAIDGIIGHAVYEAS